MIVPERTYWPSPRFTPSRLPALSRPFLLDEPAFLCAIGYSWDSALGAAGLRVRFGLSSAAAFGSSAALALGFAARVARFGLSAASALAAAAFLAGAAFLVAAAFFAGAAFAGFSAFSDFAGAVASALDVLPDALISSM